VSRSAALILLAIGALGCRRAEEDCPARAAELERFLVAMDHEPTFVPVDPGIQVVSRSDLPRVVPLRASLVAIGKELTLNQKPVTPAELTAQLARDLAELKSRRLDQPEDMQRLLVVVDRAAPWEQVVRVTEAAVEAGLTGATFVFDRPPATAPPPRSPIDDEFDKAMRADPAGRATEAARLLRGVVERCPALIEAFGHVAAVEAPDRAGHLLRSVGPAVVECNCQVDLASLRSGLWRLMGNTRPMSFLPVELSRTGAVIALPAGTSWIDANARLTPALGPTWLAIGPG
jgi:hypothetical protein